MTIVEALNDLWNTDPRDMALFVIPDWNAIIGLLPVLVVPRHGRAVADAAAARDPHLPGPQAAGEGRRFEEGPTVAATEPDGRPIFPPGLPHCRRDALIYPSGTVRCERCHDELAVICPMCGLGRPAVVDTCTNCGLVLKIKPRAVVVRGAAAGPKPGGAAAA